MSYLLKIKDCLISALATFCEFFMYFLSIYFIVVLYKQPGNWAIAILLGIYLKWIYDDIKSRVDEKIYHIAKKATITINWIDAK